MKITTKDYVYWVAIIGTFLLSQMWFQYWYYSGKEVMLNIKAENRDFNYHFPGTVEVRGGTLFHNLAKCSGAEKPIVMTLYLDSKGFRRLSYCASEVNKPEVEQKLPELENRFY